MSRATPSRRRFLQLLAAGAGSTIAASGLLIDYAAGEGASAPITDGWDRVSQILARI